MRPAAIALFASIGLTGCAADDETATSTSTTTTSTSTTSTTTTTLPGVDPARCPVADEVFCAVAVDAAEAWTGGDHETLVALSRPGTIVCAEMAQEYFPGCASADVLDGYGLSGPSLLVDIVPEESYSEALAQFTAEARGVEIMGVGTCGPDVPGQRTYHLASTFDSMAEPAVASFEFTFDETWRIALVYSGTLAEWEAAGADPFQDSFCEAGRTPWE